MSKKAMEDEEKRINNTLSEWTVEKFLDMRKEVLDRQKDLEKSNLEMVEKLRLYDEKIENLSNDLQTKMDKIIETLNAETSSKIEQKIRLSDEKIEKQSKEYQEKFDWIQLKLNQTGKALKPEVPSEMEETNDSAVITTPVDSTQEFQENDEETVWTSGKYFVLKHTFNNVSSFKDDEYYDSEEEEHFGVPWRIKVQRRDGFLGLYLYNELFENTGKKWEIEVEYELKVVSPSSRGKTEKSEGKDFDVFKSDGIHHTWGLREFIKWEELEKDFVVDDCFCAEIAMKVKKMTGIYKENLRSFDKTMEEYSDVVLIVNDEKFYVLKSFLATHSPYLKTLFMRKFNEEKKTEIKLTGIDVEDFQKYLEVLYGEQAIDETTVEGILMVAYKYDTRVVIEKCENFLQKESKKTLKKKLELSNRYNLVAFVKNEETVSTSGKYFVLKHTFNNVSSFKNGKVRFGEKEEHFGVKWVIRVARCDGFLELHLYNELFENTKKKWEIEVEYELKIVSASSREKKVKYCSVFKSDNPFTGYGDPFFIKWDELEENFVLDDCFCAEIAVKVIKMTGIYKENMRSFDKTMEEYSDVVLIVHDEKFYVLKSFLATHSSYFKTLFMRKLNEAKKTEIKLTGIDADDFQNYLEVLYGEQAIDEFTVEGVLKLADMYDTSMVIEKCENFLQKESKKTLKTKLELSTRYKLAALMKECLGEIKSIADIKSLIPGDVHNLDPSIMAELFQKSLSLHNSK